MQEYYYDNTVLVDRQVTDQWNSLESPETKLHIMIKCHKTAKKIVLLWVMYSPWSSGIVKIWPSSPNGSTLKRLSFPVPCLVSWGFSWDCITVQLLPLSYPTSFLSLPDVLILRVLPKKLSTQNLYFPGRMYIYTSIL